jgi:hypothetical protein
LESLKQDGCHNYSKTGQKVPNLDKLNGFSDVYSIQQQNVFEFFLKLKNN